MNSLDCDKLVSELDLTSWVNNVTRIMKESDSFEGIKLYSGAGYIFVNDGFRQKKLSGYAISIYNDIANIIQQIPPVPKQIVVYRGMSYPGINTKLVGEIIESTGFTSTSLDINIAKNFSNTDNGVLLSITVPPGVKLPILHKNYDTSNFNQCEFLLPLNSLLQINNKQVIDNITLLDVSIVGFNTPTTEDIINMYDDSHDKLYENIRNVYEGQYKIILNDTILNSIDKSIIYYLLATEKSPPSLYLTNIPTNVYYNIATSSYIKYVDFNDNISTMSNDDVGVLFGKRLVKSYYYMGLEFNVEYYSIIL